MQKMAHFANNGRKTPFIHTKQEQEHTNQHKRLVQKMRMIALIIYINRKKICTRSSKTSLTTRIGESQFLFINCFAQASQRQTVCHDST